MADHKIDPNSETWKAVLEWAGQQRDDAVQLLIEDFQSERMRGRIAVIDDLTNLARPEQPPRVVSDPYA